MWRGTGGRRIGTCVRQPSVTISDGVIVGTIAPTPRTAAEIVATDIGLDESGCPLSEAKQHASAWAWVTTSFTPDSSERPLCIGQWPPSQHVIRASDVAIHSAHTAAFPPVSVRLRSTTEMP